MSKSNCGWFSSEPRPSIREAADHTATIRDAKPEVNATNVQDTRLHYEYQRN